MEPRYLHLTPGNPPPTLAVARYRVVIIADVAVGDDWLNQIAEWIVTIGSLYVVAWGVDCEKWHDRVDWAVLDIFKFGDIPDERFVMTTWHGDEPLSEAFWYAGHCAIHPTVDLSETIILNVGDEAHRDAVMQSYRESQVAMDHD